MKMSERRTFIALGVRLGWRGLPLALVPLFFLPLAAVFFLFAAFGAAVLLAAGALGFGLSVLGRLFRVGGKKSPGTADDAVALGKDDYEIRDISSRLP